MRGYPPPPVAASQCTYFLLCVTIRENAVDALDRGVLEPILKAVQSFPEEEDVMTCAARILWAMSDALKDDVDPARMETLQSIGLQICVGIVNRLAMASASGGCGSVASFPGVHCCGVLRHFAALPATLRRLQTR